MLVSRHISNVCDIYLLDGVDTFAGLEYNADIATGELAMPNTNNPAAQRPSCITVRGYEGKSATVACQWGKLQGAAIDVKPNAFEGTVIARVASGTRLPTVIKFLEERADRLVVWQTRVSADLRFRVGGKVLYFGNYINIAKSPTDETYLQGRTIHVSAAGMGIGDNLYDWLCAELLAYCKRRVKHYGKRLGVLDRLGEVSVEWQDNRNTWGFHRHADHSTAYNWRLIGAPRKAIDSVVAHEVAHTNFPHHKDTFYAEWERAMPDYTHAHRYLEFDRFGALLKRLGNKYINGEYKPD